MQLLISQYNNYRKYFAFYACIYKWNQQYKTKSGIRNLELHKTAPTTSPSKKDCVRASGGKNPKITYSSAVSIFASDVVRKLS
jgi:hypothetical protein